MNPIKIETVQWNDGSMGEIAFDGKYILSVSRGEFALPQSKRTEADTDNKLTILTNHPSGWVINKITEGPCNDSDVAKWLIVSKQDGEVNEKTAISLLTNPNMTDVERIAYIHVEAGRLSYTVKAVQTTCNEIGMMLTNGSGIEVKELLFRSHVGKTVPAQTLNVSWLPRSENSVVGKFAIAGTPEFDFGSGDKIDQGIIMDQGGFIGYTIQPPAFTQEEVDANPFLEKASRFIFTVNNGNTSETKSIIIKQKTILSIPSAR